MTALEQAKSDIDRSAHLITAQHHERERRRLRNDYAYYDAASQVFEISYDAASKLSDAEIIERCAKFRDTLHDSRQVQTDLWRLALCVALRGAALDRKMGK